MTATSPETAISIDDLLGGAEDHLVATTRDGVRILIFNRPQARNALSRAVRQAFAQLMSAADQDPGIHAVIVTGAHAFFSAGVDLKENPAGVFLPIVRPHPVEVARAMTKPVIAMVDGPCVTGGLELALACSFIVASDRARFVDTHLKIGRFASWGLNTLLPAAIGMRRARQMQISGEFIGAARAYEWGLVNELTTPEGLLPRCLEIAAMIGVCPAKNVSRYVDLSRQIEGMPSETSLAVEAVTVEAFRADL